MVLKKCDRYFPSDKVETILELVEKYSKESSLTETCLSILNTLLEVCKTQLKSKVILILN